MIAMTISSLGRFHFALFFPYILDVIFFHPIIINNTSASAVMVQMSYLQLSIILPITALYSQYFEYP